MKIKLISPQMSLRPMDSEYKRVLSPSISLLILAALTPPEHDVYIEDENVKPIVFDDTPDLVGISVNVDTSERAYSIAQRYRTRGIPVVLGGIHASSSPDSAEKQADAICIGEAENVWELIIHDVLYSRLKKRYYSDKPADLSKTPAPRWELLNTSNYLYTNIVCASRGCPFACDFCYNSCRYIHQKYRYRPVENVIEEIQQLGTRHVMFIDDNFIGNIPWAQQLIDAMKPLGLTWHAAVSANIGLHDNLLESMHESGCQSLFIGLESINKNSLKSASKHQNNREEFEELINKLHQRGIMLNASMVFGFDNDYPDVFNNTLDWLVKNRVETMTAHILTPYPGTKLHIRLKQEGRIIDHDYTHYNTSRVVFKPKNMTEKELLDGYLHIYHEFYSLKNIYRRMPRNRANRIPFTLFNLGYRKFGKITSQFAKLGLMNFLGKLARRLSYGID